MHDFFYEKEETNQNKITQQIKLVIPDKSKNYINNLILLK